MMRTHGKFMYMKTYNTYTELVNIIEKELIKIRRKTYELFIIYPNRLDTMIMLYLRPDTDNKKDYILISLLERNKPLKVTLDKLIYMLEHVPGFIEKYELNNYSYESDLEFLTHLGRIHGCDTIFYEFEKHRLISKLNERIFDFEPLLRQTRSLARNGPYMLMIDKECSQKLSDITYIASYVSDSLVVVAKVKARNLIEYIDNILMEKDNILIHIFMNKHDLWIEKIKNKLCIYIYNDKQKEINIKSYIDLMHFLNNIIKSPKQEALIKYVNVYIYQKKNQKKK